MKTRGHYRRHVFRDAVIVAGSILAAFLLARAGLIDVFVASVGWSKMLASFLAGAFFTSVFTVAPAAVALVAIGGTYPPILVAFFGALGAMIIDVIIASFVRKDISEDVESLAPRAMRRYAIQAFHFGFLKWAAFIVGLFLVATPLPDEFGLFLIGLSKIRPAFLPLIFFVTHFLGIFALVSIAAGI